MTTKQQELIAKLSKLADDMEIVVERRKQLIEKAGRAFDAAVAPDTPEPDPRFLRGSGARRS